MFSVNFLPARYGDSTWIQYGEPTALRNILIDGGTGGTKEVIETLLESLPANQRHFELIVVTHVDRDHIEGILRLLEQDSLNFTVSDFWFNGYGHLCDESYEEFGAKMGENLSARLLAHKIPWNKAFADKAVVIEKDNTSISVTLPDNFKIFLLGPYREQLSKLKPVWIKEIIKAGLIPGFGEEVVDEKIESFGPIGIPDIESLNSTPFEEDDTAANGSSIALLMSYSGKEIVLAGDAFPTTILKSLKNKFGESQITLDLIKLSHHACLHNTSPQLIEAIACTRFVVSTNGASYYHPSPETIAWIIKRSSNPIFYFNYRTEHNKMWDNILLKTAFKYTTQYGDNGLTIDL